MTDPSDEDLKRIVKTVVATLASDNSGADNPGFVTRDLCDARWGALRNAVFGLYGMIAAVGIALFVTVVART